MPLSIFTYIFGCALKKSTLTPSYFQKYPDILILISKVSTALTRYLHFGGSSASEPWALAQHSTLKILQFLVIF